MITAEDITGLFKDQLESIENQELRQKVVDAWVLGCREGGWESTEELMNMPFTLLVETDGINFIEHTVAVTEGAAALARAQQDNYSHLPYAIDYDRLYAGGLLHDVGKLLEIESDGRGGYRKSLAGMHLRHPISGTVLAAECGIPEDILNIITCHSKEGEGRPQEIETIFVHQADFATFNPLKMKSARLLISEIPEV
ncbi:MAG: HD domain-containing protein [Candidatus Latescibacteria bacterium]|nr:HD domain-containing protein [bacterium]MBD3424289.1 HD domain-containing protein [Candidatus Latescibacterota bacterium]